MQLHLPVILDHSAQYFFNFTFLFLEFAKLLVKVVYEPDGSLVQLVRVLVLAVSGDHGYVEVLDAEKFEDFEDFLVRVSVHELRGVALS